MTRRQFSREFKREAVHLVTQRGVSVAQAARDLDLHAIHAQIHALAYCAATHNPMMRSRVLVSKLPLRTSTAF